MKLPDLRPGLPGNVISFYIAPLDPAHRARLAGRFPATPTIPPYSLPGFRLPRLRLSIEQRAWSIGLIELLEFIESTGFIGWRSAPACAKASVGRSLEVGGNPLQLAPHGFRQNKN